MNPGVHHHTPTLAAIDGRGLVVRQVQYLRATAADAPQAQVSRQHHDAAAHVVAQYDPRHNGPQANLNNLYSLGGAVLCSISVDSGWRIDLPGVAGQALQRWDQRGSHQRSTFDPLLRPTAIVEQARAGPAQTVQRLTYGDGSAAYAQHNQCGRLVAEHDSAGRLSMDEYAVNGAPLRQGRRFLKGLDMPDWPPTAAGQEALLEPDTWLTQWRYNASGVPLEQTDARNHRQHLTYGLDGRPKRLALQLHGAATVQTLVEGIEYNADGQIQAQVAGNGVVSVTDFDPADGRLRQLKAFKGSTVFQHLSQAYDPVGNVIALTDHTQAIRYAANQRLDGSRAFTYDSLYRLASATGLEGPGASTQPQLPPLISPIDLTRLGGYTQTFAYDNGNNLTRLTHVSALPGRSHTVHMRPHDQSNRCLGWQKGQGAELEMTYDAAGNLLTLQPGGQALAWTVRNQLQGLTQVSRAHGDDDRECYVYDSTGQRLRTWQRARAAAVEHIREVRYLTGLEVRTVDGEQQVLHVVTLQAGHIHVRCLHWAAGKPDGIDADQLRYSLTDPLGSLDTELDQQAHVISREGYYPFGGTAWQAARSQVEAEYKTVRYSGKERDSSGLYYYGARYYAPWLQRWASADPAGAVDGLNLYGFCGSNPISRTDPDGRMWQDDDPALDRVLDEFVEHEQSLRYQYGLPPIASPASEHSDDEEAMQTQDSPASLQSQGSPPPSDTSHPATPESLNPPPPTAEQHSLLERLNTHTPQFQYSLNNRNLLARGNFGGKVYRADRRTPAEVAREGFKPSDEFTAIPKMIGGDALIVAESLTGVLEYAAYHPTQYYLYEIDATDVRGVSLLENMVLNNEPLLKHLDQTPDFSPYNQTGGANRMHEAHLSHDDLITFARPMVSIGRAIDVLRPPT